MIHVTNCKKERNANTNHRRVWDQTSTSIHIMSWDGTHTVNKKGVLLTTVIIIN